jgi:hypothetical protein
VKITWDNKKVADGGMVRITAYDPYTKDNTWTAKASDGTEYKGAEVTSEGFQIFGLPPYQYYSAGIACFMTGNDWLQDNHDVWNNSMDLAGITNKGIVGFKYFGFGGLDKDTKGVKAFEGIKKGDGAVLNLCLTPGGHGAFRIHVMLDGPYDNVVWKGREIGVLDVPATPQRQGANTYQIPVPAVEGLTGKHAIYLVAEGPEVEQPKDNNPWRRQMGPQRPQGLFDLHGLGFSKTGTTCQPPEVPQVTILVDGQKLNIPATPIRCSNANGLTDAIRYQVYAPLKDNSKIQVLAPETAEVSPIVSGRATITCTYKGLKKIFLIN